MRGKAMKLFSEKTAAHLFRNKDAYSHRLSSTSKSYLFLRFDVSLKSNTNFSKSNTPILIGKTKPAHGYDIKPVLPEYTEGNASMLSLTDSVALVRVAMIWSNLYYPPLLFPFPSLQPLPSSPGLPLLLLSFFCKPPFYSSIPKFWSASVSFLFPLSYTSSHPSYNISIKAPPLYSTT